MDVILGIDAAWTSHHPSGVALIRKAGPGTWESLAVKESYASFVQQAGVPADKHLNGRVPVPDLLKAAHKLAGSSVTLVVADIPLATGQITGRRFADNQISSLFGKNGCSAHSPTLARPGCISEEIRDGFSACDFRLATDLASVSNFALIETYPHPALLSLMRVRYRVPYKVCKSKTYNPRLSRAERLAKIIENLEQILGALKFAISGVDFLVPKNAKSFSSLKSTEDKIDALVCAWVGTQVLEGKALPVGDEHASVWVPTESFT